MAEFISVILLCLFGIMAYAFWEHKNDERDAKTQFVGAIKEMTAVAKDGVQAQREMNCLIALPQDMREKQAQFCKNISR